MTPDFQQAIDAAVTDAVATAFRVLQANIINGDNEAADRFAKALDSIQKAMDVAAQVAAKRKPGDPR